VPSVILQANPKRHSTYCYLYRRALEGKNIPEGLLIREREDLPCVVWGSGRECHVYLMVRIDDWSAL
jgi:hypothetical protein